MIEVKNQFLENPENSELLNKLEVHYSTEENWQELLEIYDAFVKNVAEEELQNRYILKKAVIYDEMLEKPEKAVEELKTLIEYEDFTYTHFKYFESLCKNNSLYDMLIELYQIVLPKVDDEYQLNFNCELSSLYLKKGDFQSSIQYIGNALSIDYSDTKSLNLLDFILNKKQNDPEILILLEPLFQKIEDWDNLLNVYNYVIVQKDQLSDQQIIDIYNKKVELMENYFPSEEEIIFDTLFNIYKLNQGNFEVFEKIEFYAENIGNHSKLIKDLIAIYDESGFQPFIAYKIGTIAYMVLGENKLALKYLLTYSNSVDQYHQDAFGYLIDILNMEENYQLLVQTYLTQIEFIEDESAKIDILQQVALIYEERLFKLDEAINIYKKIVEITPDNVTYYLQLERLYGSAHNWNELLEIVDKVRDMVEEVEQYDLKKAKIFDLKLQNYSAAIDQYKNFLELYGYVDNKEIVNRLIDLYNQEEKYQDLKDFLEQYKDFVMDQEESEKIDYEIAEIVSSKFDDYDEAFMKLTSILDMNPEHENGLKLMFRFLQDGKLVEQIYDYLDNLLDTTDNIPYWVRLNQIKIKQSEDKEEQSFLCEKVGDIFINRTSEPEKAYDYFAASIQLNPSDSTYNRFKEYVESMGFEERSIESLDKVLSIVDGESDLYLTIHFDIGITLFNLSRFSEAEPYFKKVISIDKTNIRSLDALDEIYSSTEKNDALFYILQLKLDITEEKVEILYRLRDISIEHFNDKEKTVTFLYQLYDYDQYNQEIHRDMLIEYLSYLQKWEELSKFYERVLDIEPDPKYIEALADLYFKYLDNYERAYELYEQILDLADNRIKILSSLEVIYEKLENYTRLVTILEDKFELLKLEGDKVGVIELIFKLGQLYLEKVDQYERAQKMFAYLVKAHYDGEKLVTYLKNFIENYDILPYISETLEFLYQEQTRWEELIVLYQNQLNYVLEDDKIALNIKIADIYIDYLDKQLNAIEYYDYSFQLTQDSEIISKIYNILLENQKYQEIVDLYQKYIDSIDFNEIDLKISIYLTLAEISSKYLSQTDKAIEFLNDAYDLDETRVDVLNPLINYLMDNEDFDRVKELYYRKLELLDDDIERTSLKLKISKFLVEKFRDFDQSITLLGEILEWDPLEDRATKFLLKLNSYIDSDNFELKLRVLNILKPVYTDSERYDELEDIFSSVISIDGIDEAKKLELMKEEIEIFFEVAEFDRGMKKYQEALIESKGDNFLLNEGIRYAEITADYDKLIMIYKSLMPQIKDINKAFEVYLLLGDVSFKYLAQFEQAEKYYQAILDKQPEHIDALNRLEEMYQEYGEYEKLQNVYKKLISVIEDKNKLSSVYLKIGNLFYDNLSEVDQSIQYYEKVVEIDGKNEEILGRLFDFYKTNKNIDAIVSILEKYHVLYPEDVYHLNRYSFFLLKSYKKSENGEQLNKACDLAEKAYEIDKNPKTESILLEAYKDSKAYSNMVQIYKNRIDSSSSIDEQIDHYIELAKLYAEYLDNITEAEKCVEFIRENDPYNDKIIDVREKILSVQEKWPELVQLLDQKIDISEGEILNSAIFKKVQILAEHLNLNEDALEMIEDLINRDPENREYLFYAEEIHNKLGSIKQYFDFIKNRVPEIESENLKAHILVKMGDIAYKNFSKEALAIKCYNKALEYEEHFSQAIDSKKQIALDKNDYSMYAELLQSEFEYCEDEDKKLEIKNELIEIYLEKLKKPEMVIPFKEEEFNQDQENQEKMLELINLYSKSNQPYNFFQYYDNFFNTIKTDRTIPEKHLYMFSLGKACQTFGNYDFAQKCYNMTNRLKMGYIPAQMALGTLLMEQGDSKGALKSFQMLQLNQSKIKDPELKIELFLKIGQLRAKDGDNLRAKSAYKKVLELDPNNEEAKNYLG